ncbi:hypothetical protein SAMN05216184_11763 [Georgenia satyanarayanai]|uniref:Uncharacterized protein n=1 Tax=Georgenia satyanarayanai TaxID=860221 RepID=A0A2Y9APM5_9MICO|nr:hypothetical protein A8987_11763 [Georgenia satyanarayanai]SSA46441.1 hypothetical protein SAMN05216184_11763 [Georgenia satyanarayanai]
MLSERQVGRTATEKTEQVARTLYEAAVARVTP